MTGLPEGIAFKKPGQYGLRQVRQIMEHPNDIQILIKDDGQVTNKHIFWQLLNENERKVYRSILNKIVDDEKVSSCILKNEVIEEHDLEVTNLDLSKTEFDILSKKLNHVFERDALTTLAANYESSRFHQGYILPVYTDTDEPFWLFYYPTSADAFEALSAEDKIWGYWLDKRNEALTYDILENVKTCIIGLNMICSQEKEIDSLRYKSSILDARINIPSSFDKSILECLAEQGFL